MITEFEQDLAARLAALEATSQLRRLTPVEHEAGGTLIGADGRRSVNLAGNDYLGLADNVGFRSTFYAERRAEKDMAGLSLGSTASRLMSGNTPSCALFEKELARFYGAEAALFFNSGYHLNLGLLPALTEKADLVVADKLCHASLIDAMRLCRAKVLRYPHLDYGAIERIFQRERDRFRHAFLVTESIFSMDGDCADLNELVRLKEKWGAQLYVDEAHGVGIRGENGLGLAEEQGALAGIDLFVGTCGKAWGGMGAFVVGRRVVVDWLVNTARPHIFSTALPPVNLEWLRFVLKRLPGLGTARRRVADLAARLREALTAAGLTTCGDSHIVPVLLGEAERTLVAAQALREAGYWATAIRPPTVPKGSCRLRLSLNANMNWETLAPLPKIIVEAVGIQ